MSKRSKIQVVENDSALAARARQQAVVASLGRLALSGMELERLFQGAVGMVADTLEVEFCKILELSPEGGTLKLTAGVGWKEGLVGTVNVGAERGSQAGFTLLSRQPVIVEDLRAETRFDVPALLRDHGVVSGVSVVIGSSEKPFGVLGAHTARQRRFSRDDAQFMQSVANVLADAIQRAEAEEALRESEARYRDLFENNPNPMWIYDVETLRIVSVNEMAVHHYGYSREEFLSMTIADIRPEEDLPRLFANIGARADVIQRSKGWRHRKKNGDLIDVEIVSHSLPEINGKKQRLVVVIDVTERRQTEEQIERRVVELEALYQSGIAFSQTLDPREIGEKVIEVMVGRLDWHHAALRVRRGESQELELLASSYAEDVEQEGRLRSMITRVGQGMVGWVVEHGKPVRAVNLSEDPRYVETFLGMKSGLYVPIRIYDRTFGCISVESERENAFTEEDERLLSTLAVQAAVALENARLFQDLQRELAERKQTEKALEESETRYRSLLDQLPAIVYLDDARSPEPTPRFVSPRIRDILGYDPEEWLAGGFDLWRKSIHPEDLDRAVKHYLHSIQTEETYFQDYRMIARDGRAIWVRDSATILRDENGAPLSMHGVIYDITESKQADEKIQRQLKREAALREIDQAIVSSFDMKLSLNIILSKMPKLLSVDAAAVLLLNPATNTLEYAAGLGFRTQLPQGAEISLDQSYAGKVVLERRAVQIPNLAYRGRASMPAGFPKNEGFVSYYGIPLVAKGQAIGALEAYNRSVVERDEDWFNLFGTLASQAAIAVDNARLFFASQRELAERKLAEEKLRNSYAELEKRIEERTADLRQVNFELERALRVKDEFLANMSHELRTPLNAVIGLSDSLMEQTAGTLNDKQQKYVSIVRESGQHLLELINDILDLAKIESGRVTLDRDKVDIAQVCQSSLRMIRQLALKKNLEILFEMDADLGMIWADERKLKQMLVNLLSNAVKFTPENGRIGLQVRGDREGNSINFTVWDTGIGIHENDLPRLFQPFVQLDSNLARRSGGTGLGLALVAKMAGLHGGSVGVESQPDQGSRFTVKLPWETAFTTETLAALASDDDETTKPDPRNKDHTILLIEDTEEVVLLVKDYLEYIGFNVTIARNGVEGIALAEKIEPSLILMDVQMPVMDGLEATRRMRKIAALRDTPIIALTALAMKGDRELCLEAGMNDYIGKPVNLKTLARIVNNRLHPEREVDPP